LTLNIFVKVNEVDVAPPAFYSPRLYKLFEVDESVLVLASGFCQTAKLRKCSQKLPILGWAVFDLEYLRQGQRGRRRTAGFL